MAANKKPRKPYRAKTLPALPIRFGLSAEAKTALVLPAHVILDAFRRGHGDESGAHTLAACVNLGAVLSRRHSNEAQQIMQAGVDAVAAIMARGIHGRWGVSGDELQALAAALTLSDDMQAIETRHSLREAIRIVYAEAAI